MKLILRDKNPDLVEAWKLHFKGVPDVEANFGHIFEVAADALVSPANSFGFMNGGIDAVYSTRFGLGLQGDLQDRIVTEMDGEIPVGGAMLVEIKGDKQYKWLIAAPTMRVPMDISGTVNAYMAMRAVLRLVKKVNAGDGDKIESVLCPGLGTAVGRLPVNIAAFQMREAYRVVMEEQPLNFPELEDAWRHHERLRRGLPGE